MHVGDALLTEWLLSALIFIAACALLACIIDFWLDE